MTVYVDNYRVPARVGQTRGRWSHLTADTPEELNAFALSIGLKLEWFQRHCKYGKCQTREGCCVHFHYDVTDVKRQWAIRRGAKAVDLREFGAICSARRTAWRESVETQE